MRVWLRSKLEGLGLPPRRDEVDPVLEQVQCHRERDARGHDPAPKRPRVSTVLSRTVLLEQVAGHEASQHLGEEEPDGGYKRRKNKEKQGKTRLQ